MRTPRLYWDDPLLLDFDATVVANAEAGRHRGFILDRTAFYPEAGGQLADRGAVRWGDGRAAVVDALEDGEGRVLHATDGEPPPPGARVNVSVDAARRRAHMSQHTGQHLLSRVLLDVVGAATVSSRLGEETCTIDTPLERLDPALLAEAVRRANAAVLENRRVVAHFPTPAELAAMPLRRDPKVTDDVRVIEIEGLDFSPCGGTHCTATGQVGAVFIDGVERHKGGTRITFRTGTRALDTLFARDAALKEIGRGLTCGWDEAGAAVAKLRTELQASRKESEKLLAQVASAVAETLVSRGEGTVVAAVDGSPALLRAVADRLGAVPGRVSCVWCADGDGAAAVVACGPGATGDAGALLRKVSGALGGRGGGRAGRAEGRWPVVPDPARVRAILEGA